MLLVNISFTCTQTAPVDRLDHMLKSQINKGILFSTVLMVAVSHKIQFFMSSYFKTYCSKARFKPKFPKPIRHLIIVPLIKDELLLNNIPPCFLSEKKSVFQKYRMAFPRMHIFSLGRLKITIG